MMDPTLKNRLVGVLVLLLLAAVLLPLLFDGANEQSLLAETRMPVPPDVPQAEALLADPPATLPAAETEIAAAHAPAEPEPAVLAPPAVPQPAVAAPVPVTTATQVAPAPVDARLAGLAEAWDVQVAAVSTAEAASQLRTRLAAAGYKARVQPAGVLFRILVGPELRKEDAASLRDKLAADGRIGKLNGRLVRYVP